MRHRAAEVDVDDDDGHEDRDDVEHEGQEEVSKTEKDANPMNFEKDEDSLRHERNRGRRRRQDLRDEQQEDDYREQHGDGESDLLAWGTTVYFFFLFDFSTLVSDTHPSTFFHFVSYWQ